MKTAGVYELFGQPSYYPYKFCVHTLGKIDLVKIRSRSSIGSARHRFNPPLPRHFYFIFVHLPITFVMK